MNPLKKWFQSISYHKTDDPEKKKVCWLILGKILGNLLFLSDDEENELSKLDDHDPTILNEIIREFVVPHYRYFLPEDQAKLKTSLAYYLTNDTEKLEWVFSSLYAPLNDDIAAQFYTIVWQELYGTDNPEPVNPEDYEEDCSPTFVNSIFYRGELVKKYNPEGKKPSIDNIKARLEKQS